MIIKLGELPAADHATEVLVSIARAALRLRKADRAVTEAMRACWQERSRAHWSRLDRAEAERRRIRVAYDELLDQLEL